MTKSKLDKSGKLRDIQDVFVDELPSRLSAIHELWNEGDVDDILEFQRKVHSLTGSAGSFGFPLLGYIANELEIIIQQRVDSSAQHEFDILINQVIQRMQVVAKNGPEVIEPVCENLIESKYIINDEAPLVYVLEDDIRLAEETQQQLQHFEYNVEIFHRVNDFHAAVVRQVPDALLVDIHLPEGKDAGPRAVAELSKLTTTKIPVIFTSAYNDWEDRLNAVRARGQAYLSKPINFISLVEQLDSITGKKQEKDYRILIVDDTALLTEHYAAVLQNAGMQTEVLYSAERILDVLAVFRPDLILMDIYMPGCSGIEAAAVIRQHSAYSNTAIIYLSTERDLDQQLEALQVGGDDFLQKPISDSQLVTAVRTRAKRYREMSALMNRDSLTGLLNHINLKLALERQISQAQRRDADLAFAMLDIDHFKSVNDEYGHPVGDQVIKSLSRLLTQRLRKSDVIARYGGEEFAVILPDTSADEAYQLIDDLRKQFSQITYSHVNGDFNVMLSAGIAEYKKSTDMESLIVAADNALYKAKNSGRNQVLVSDDEAG